MNRKFLVLTLAAATLAIGNMYAAVPTTATGKFNVTITVANSCIVQVNDVAFGTQTSLISVHTASALDNVKCTGTSPVVVSFDTGISGTYANRTMTNGGASVVNYNLFDAASAGNVLGDGSGSTVKFTLTPSGSNNVNANDQFTVYGQTVANQAVTNGAYTDAITATVTF